MAASNPLSLLNFGAPPAHTPDTAEEPLFSVVYGNPTEEELAALVAVVSSLREDQQEKDSSAMALWQRRLNRGQRMGVKLRPGPGSWRRARPM